VCCCGHVLGYVLCWLCGQWCQADEILLAFHRVVSVQLTLPNVRSDERTPDDDVDDYAPLAASLHHNSVDGATVAVH